MAVLLRPLLWNIYNQLLEAAVPAGVQLVCYADDTLLVASGRSWTRTPRLMQMAVAAITTLD